MDNASTNIEAKGSDSPPKPRHWTIREEETGISHLKLLGEGGFGEVHELFNAETEKSLARKVIRVLGRIKKDDVDNEVRALKKLCQNQHPNIVQVFDFGQLNPDSTIYYIDMELCDISLAKYLSGGELKDVVSWATVREEEDIPTHAYNILQQILNGLVYIHCMEEVHRDLSPHNILFRNGFWKIADFGLTSKGTSKRLVTTSAARGKDSYRAPELLRDSESGYNNKSDMWSFGCIAFELLTGRKAFSNDFEVYQYGAAKRSPKMYFKGLDVLAKHYLSGLLEVDPEKRPSARALLKEKFLTETPSADSAATVRAQKRRRASLTVSFATSTEPSSLLKASWDWAVSNRQLDLILGLIEAGLEPANSSEAYDALDAFRADWDSSSYIRLGRFVNLYEAPSMISKSGVGTLESGDFIDQGKSSENAFALDTTQWSMSAMSRLGGSDWLAICANNLFDISDVHTEPLQSVLFPFDAQLQFSEDGKHFAYWRRGEMGFLYEILDNSYPLYHNLSLNAVSIGIDLNTIDCLRFTHNTAQLIVAYRNGGGLCVWDLATKTAIILQLELSGTYQVRAFGISRDDARLIGVSPLELTIWSLETGKIMEYQSLSVLFNISAVGSTHSQNAFRGYYVTYLDGALPGILPQGDHTGKLNSIACSHTNPQQVISGSDDHSVTLWTVPAAAFRRSFNSGLSSPPALPPMAIPFAQSTTFSGHHESVSTVAFSPDDRWIASGSLDGSVRFWNPSDGSLVLLLYGHRGKSVTSVNFLPSSLGNLLAVAYEDGTLRFWNYNCNVKHDFGATPEMKEVME